MNGKLFLIDGHSLIFKMYYAFLNRPMVNSKGEDTSILFGFLKYMLEMVQKEQPTHLAVAFDPPGGTFRNRMFPQYKANRPPTPPLVINALKPLKELLANMNIPVLMVPDFEADDVIGTVALKGAEEGFEVYMVTPDKDYGQLVSGHILQYRPGNAGGAPEILDSEALCKKWEIPDTKLVIDMLAICGDTADNVPGVRGVGPVGAARIVSKFGTLENIYANLDSLTQSQRDKFEEARDHISLSKELVTIKTDVPVAADFEAMRLSPVWESRIVELFDHYEFNSLKKFIPGIAGGEAAVPEEHPFTFKEASAREVCRGALLSGKCSLALRVVDNDMRTRPAGLILASFSESGDIIAAEGTLADYSPVLSDGKVLKFGEDLKLRSHQLRNIGATIAGPWMDISLMHYLIDPEKDHSMEKLSEAYLHTAWNDIPEGGITLSLFDDADTPAADYLRQAAILLSLGEKIRAGLNETQLRLFKSMEEPLIKILAGMEEDGVRVDLRQIADYSVSLRAEVMEREARVRELAGEPSLNVSSPKQVGDVLFDKLKLDPKAKKSSKGQYSTDETTLLEIASRHPIVDEILEFRAAKKLLSTYIEPFAGFVHPEDGRVHTTYNQALTATGRLSSSSPNLQNIPVRTERGREIRKAFVPGTPDGLIMAADYSQIELRIMAHLSQDSHLIEAFREGTDVHAVTAAKIFGIPPEKVTPDQRRMAKTANFGIMYGISSFGLAQRLRVSRTEAKQLIDGYFGNFPAIRSFIDASIASARENGYVETLLGRRRYLPDINAHNANLRAFAERNAVNAPIQGSAADIIKLAMIKVASAMEGFRSRMVLQVHDELVFDVVRGEEEALMAIVVREMENALKISVPLTVECKTGINWLEAH